ncbi:MAG TPA: hypothetical protein VFM10_07375 [Terriglobales bacterium]|nr:hypothetical protein [Terriglobales bacterium]
MNFLFLLPFSYFYATRLRNGSLAFHVLFEWVAAAVLVACLGAGGVLPGLATAALAYLAFISVYEIGYLWNDLVAARKEAGGRLRGPQGAGNGWLAAWIAVRLAAFVAMALVLGRAGSMTWWAFFAGLGVVFSLHNHLQDKELKAITFIWLAWYRFLAPVIFAVPMQYLPGIAFVAGFGYAGFRLFAYLDSKGLLAMPGRQRMVFRWMYFALPLLAMPVLAAAEAGRGAVILSLYYATVASLGYAASSIKGRLRA